MPVTLSIAVVGAGRLGSAMAAALRAAGYPVEGPLGRGEQPAPGTGCVLLCVPDGAIGAAAAEVSPRDAMVGHCSGATGLDVLGDRESFSLHPLMTVTPAAGPGVFAGAGCAVAGSTPRALEWAKQLAADLRMQPVEVADGDRVAYHAAASMASNFLVGLEHAAERLAATAGVGRELLAPLVVASARNWAVDGAGSLTGPIARGDRETVARQRAAVSERTPELLELWDALAGATEAAAR